MARERALRSLVVVGGQWGDEGKGKIVDLLSAAFTAVVRYNGGHNAGHTVRVGERRFALHLVPSGVIHPEVACYMAAGMVVDPTALVSELDTLAGEGIDTRGRLFLSPRAALILPTHRALDLARESASGEKRIGTTGRGIGPAYSDLARRTALRAHLLATPDRLVERACAEMAAHNRELTELLGAPPVDVGAALDELQRAAERTATLLREVGPEVRHHLGAGEPVLFEGAQGVLLDLVWGTYPYVTSSSCLPAAAACSVGLAPRELEWVLGIMKAYATRVGAGPFPSELEGPAGEQLRQRGVEFGTTTGRPRRCGWFDAVAARHAVELAGIDAVGIMKLDVLDGLEEIQVVVGYELPSGERLESMPDETEALEQVRPVLRPLPGWSAPTTGVTDPARLPREAVAYLRFLEQQLAVPVVLVSTGARREETMLFGSSPLKRRLERMLPLP